jgi:hypothetical protein
MQTCCGSGKRPEILDEIKAAHPECHLVTDEGKAYTAGYTGCSKVIFIP